MDLESEGFVNLVNVSLADDHKIEHNGSCSNEIDELGTGMSFVASASPADSEGNSVEGPVPLKKGVGLRKWRRIRRDIVKDSGCSLDSGKVLKRGLSAPRNLAKSSQLSVEARQTSEGSVGSINMVKHRSLVDGFEAHASSADSRFASGTYSGNSEDRSSKSSTAATVPKAKHDLSGKNSGSSSQHVQQGKGRTESSKKHRGERVKIEKENTYSSKESTSNGKLSRAAINYDGAISDESHASEQEEMQAGYSKEYGEEAEDVSPDGSAAELSWEAKEENSENHQSSTDGDPLVESILTLQSVQEALEQELRKYEEIGKEYASPGNNNSEGISVAADFSYDKTTQFPSSSETHLPKLSQKTKLLESELEQARAMLHAKDSKIAELEAASRSGSPKKEKYKEMETEIDELWKEKMEAEIGSMVITMETRKYRVPVVDQITLLEEQKALAEQQAELVHKLEETENKAEMIKKQAEDLDECCSDFLGTEEIFDMKKRVCRVTSCFIMQVILVIFVIWMVVSQFSPKTEEIVPT